MGRGLYTDAKKALEKKHNTRKKDKNEEIQEWRIYWREAGPIRFAEEILTCWREVPPHPDIGRVPDYNVLTEDQKTFLYDLWMGLVDQFILVAGRGSGKTYMIAIYTCWRIVCFDDFTLTVMGGSSGQSMKIKSYIDFWRNNNEKTYYCLPRSVESVKEPPHVASRWGGKASFPACSNAATRGPRSRQVFIDEVCLHPESELYINNGITSKVTNIKIGDEVLSHDGTFHTITKVFKRFIDEDIIEIKPYYYSIGLKLTKNHPVLSCKRNEGKIWFEKEKRWMQKSRTGKENNIKLEWNPVGNLEVNDYVAFPIPKLRTDYNPRIFDLKKYLKKTTWNNIINVIPDENFYELIGWYIAEGSTNKDRVFFSLNRGEENYIIELIRKVFKKEPQLHYFKSNNCVNVFFSSRAVARWLKDLCGHGAKNKHIPYDFMNLPEKYKDVLLKGILDGDASENDNNYRLHTSSYDLGIQFTLIMASKGLFVGIQKAQDGYEFTLNKTNRFGFIKDNYLIIPIRKINKINYIGDVYNFSVEETETYCSPFTILHNCVGESRSREGAEAIAAAKFQMSSSPTPLFGMTSTAQYILGSFYGIWRNATKLGFKKYRWSIARHISDKWWKHDADGNYILDKKENKIPDWDYIDEILAKDRKSENWISNVWWVPTPTIQTWRRGGGMERAKTDDEWLVEVLGGISKGTGLVFSRSDLNACICDGSWNGKWYTDNEKSCEECQPYTDSCPYMKKNKLELSMISNRKCGVDFGDIAAMTIDGERERMVYTLYSDERSGLRSDEMLSWILGEIEKLKGIHEVFADPEERAMKEAIEDRGYSTPHIWALGGGVKKNFYVTNYKRLIEQHKRFIPKKFFYLTESLKTLSYDEKGGIRKHNDHSFDSDLYACVDYDPDATIDEFWTETKETDFKVWG